MNNLFEYKKQKGKYTLKWLYLKNKDFTTKFKVIKIYLKTDNLLTIDDNGGETIISNVSFCGRYLKTEEDLNYGFLEGEGVEGIQLQFP